MALLLLDGNSLTYRAFFALPTDLATASGQVTNAVYGFTSMLINLLRDHQPSGLAVAFDRPEPTFRHEQVADYKAQREAAPDILRQQMGLVRQVLEALHIPILEAPGFEADDIIATLATQARDAGRDVIVVTGDRDVYQLVEDPHVKVLYNRRGVSDYVLYDEGGIRERTGVDPIDYVAYAALRGDPSDNLPGVSGVGEKTAAKLINTFGGIDGIYEHLDQHTPKLRQNLEAGEKQVRSNAQVMVLRRDVPLDVGIDDLGRRPLDPDATRDLFNFLEFHSLADRLSEAVGEEALRTGAEGGTLEVEAEPWPTAADAIDALGVLATAAEPLSIGVAWVGDPGRSALAGLAFAAGDAPERAGWLPGDLLADGEVSAALRTVLGRPGIRGHRVKELLRALLDLGLDVPDLGDDTAVAAYLLDPAESRYELAELAERYLHLEVRSPDAPAAGQLDLDGTGEAAPDAAAREAAAVARLAPMLRALIAQQGSGALLSLYDGVERPLVRVLARMEHVGVGIDVERLRALSAELAAEAETLRQAVWDDAGEEFNVNSTPQLRHILFEKLGLAPQKKTKTGYSTDAQTLEKLRDQHQIVDHLLRYREVDKLRSTFAEGLAAEVAVDGRIHASFNQTVARTGRLSSDRPNLHNIPVRSEMGRRFRGLFVPADGFELLVADYNQIELRVIAHLAEDPGLIDAFESGTDIHTATAARVFGVASDAVDIGMRSKAKMVSYGLAYGMEAYGLAQRLAIEVPEAQEILDAYFAAFPNVRSYMERTVAEARERGYTETLFGRRRPIPELSASNVRLRQAGERQAMNAGIQGLAADVFKVALVRLADALDAGRHRSRLVLQVHDEIIVEVDPAERDEVGALCRSTMEHAAELRVPLAVNLAFGPSWADAKA